MRYYSILTVCFIALLGFNVTAQSDIDISDQYQGELTDVKRVSDMYKLGFSQVEVQDVLKSAYQTVNSTVIDNDQLDLMIDPTQINYDIWLTVLKNNGVSTASERTLILGILARMKSNI